MSFTALPKEIFQILGARGHGACIHSGHPAPEPLRFPASFYKSGTAFPESADPCVTRDAQRSNDQHPMHIKAVVHKMLDGRQRDDGFAQAAVEKQSTLRMLLQEMHTILLVGMKTALIQDGRAVGGGDQFCVAFAH